MKVKMRESRKLKETLKKDRVDGEEKEKLHESKTER